MRMIGSVTSKGQTTIPKEVRDRLGLDQGTRIEWTVQDGQAVIKPRKLRAIDLAGILGPPPNGPKTLEEIEEGIADAWAEHGMRGLR